MTRFRDLGYQVGRLPIGQYNAITDVAGVKVGHTTLIQGEGKLVEGQGPIRTGVTVVLPHGGNIYQEKVPASVFTINGYGKATGFEQIREMGSLETPIALTNTLNVPRVADALMSYMMRDNPTIGWHTGTVNPVVGECNDGFFSDIRGRHVREEHVFAALESATSGPVSEGNVGGGTGTRCMGFKGGIGTASRLVAEGQFTVGALVQTNFGRRDDLMVIGVPVGQELLVSDLPIGPMGSLMMVLATDAPVSNLQLEKMAIRAAFGIGRVGGYATVGSGDFVIAFTTASRLPHAGDAEFVFVTRLHNNQIMNQLYLAVVESIEEAILNSMIAAETMVGVDGNTMPALPHDKLVAILRKYGRHPASS